MRSTLFVVGALLLLSYPMVLLLAVARNLGEPGTRPHSAAITHSRAADDAAPSSYRSLRNTTLRRSSD